MTNNNNNADNPTFIPPHGNYRELLSYRKAEVAANIAICLIHQANYLLGRQIRRREQDFLRAGGLRERMARARLNVRGRQRNRRARP